MSLCVCASRARCLALLLVFWGGTVQAESNGNVSVSVLSILASDKGDKVEAKLQCVAREVKKVDPKLTNFRLAFTSCKSVPVGAKETFELADKQTATVIIDRWTDGKKDERVQLKITPPLLGEITYTSACGKFLPIMTRYRTSDNELLILCVKVQHCTGKKE